MTASWQAGMRAELTLRWLNESGPLYETEPYTVGDPMPRRLSYASELIVKSAGIGDWVLVKARVR